jgi:hypothetical protein
MKQLALMLKVVTAQDATYGGDYLQLKGAKPESLYDTLNDKLGVIAKGDFSGVSVDKAQAYKTVDRWVEDRAAHWESAGRDMCDNWVDAHMEEAEGHYEKVREPDGLTSTTRITTSKRADIRQEDGVLFLARETVDAQALKERYETVLRKSPVAEVFGALLGAKKTKPLTEAFNAVTSIKPLSVAEANDNAAVRKLQETYSAAVAGVKEAVRDSGVLDLLPRDKVKALVKRAAGVDI